jgi:hypothetical protein
MMLAPPLAMVPSGVSLEDSHSFQALFLNPPSKPTFLNYSGLLI